MDGVLGTAEPNGSFHDAILLSVLQDGRKRQLTLEFDLCVGNPNSNRKEERERRRRGRLKVDGLRFWILDSPMSKTDRPFITDDGPLSECSSPTAKRLHGQVADGEIAWYLFFNDTNSFAYVAGKTASFEWH